MQKRRPKILIRGGRLIDPSRDIDGKADVLLERGRVKAVSGGRAQADIVIDASGMIVTPGLIDMHVHLREPGMAQEETIASGSAAAVAGGFTSVAAMPNTSPVVDNRASAEFIILQAERADLANIYPVGAITKGSAGKELSEIGQLSRGGTVAFTDDGNCVRDADVMRRALEYASMFDKAVLEHCEDMDLSAGGVMHEGYYSTLFGLPGIPAASEEVIVARDIILAEMTGARLHIMHITSAGSVALVKAAKQRGAKVTAEVTPHHFTLSDESLKSYNPDFKMNPPLRTKRDIAALRKGLAEGVIDAIASDHAPHSPEEKALELDFAPFGAIGMESMLPIVITELIEKKELPWKAAIEKLTINPARILNIPKGTLGPGADADVTIIDPHLKWTIDVNEFKSKSRNCPFHGWKVTGRAVCTIVSGQIKYRLDGFEKNIKISAK